MSVLLINGISGSLGRAICENLQPGMYSHIIGVGRSTSLDSDLIEFIRSIDLSIEYHSIDLNFTSEVERFCKGLFEAQTDIRGVVNVAASTERTWLNSFGAEKFDMQVKVNVTAPILFIKYASALMENNKSAGSIVNIGSVCAYGGPPNLLGYSATKSALTAVTKNTAFSLMRSGIRVNQINAGWTATIGEERIQASQGASTTWKQEAASVLPFGRLIQPAEIANLVVYLLSARSGLLTGSIIDFDQSVQGAGEVSRPIA